MRCQENQPEFTAALRRSCVGFFEVVLVEIVKKGETETKTMFRITPSLGDNLVMQFIQRPSGKLSVIAIAHEVHVDDGISVMVVPRLDIDPYNFDSAV